MKIKRAIETTIYAIIILLSQSSVSFAEQHADAERAASNLISLSIKKQVISPSDEQYFLGDAIPAYYYDGNSIAVLNNATYQLVYAGNKIAGILKANDVSTGDPCYSFSEGYVDDIAALTQNGAENFFLFSTVNKLFAYSNGESVLLEEYPFISVEDRTVIYKKNSLTLGNSNSIGDFTDDDVNFLIGNSDYDFNNSTTQKNMIYVNTAVPFGGALNPWKRFLAVKQPAGSNVCWAITCWEIGEWETNEYLEDVNTTYQIVLDAMNKSMYNIATIDEAKIAIKKVYNVDMQIKGRALTGAEVDAQIDRFKPMYSNWYDSAWSTGHTVAIYGGNNYDPNDPRIIFMESLTGKGVTMSPNSQGKFVMTYTNTPYIWSDTMIVS